MENNKVSNQQVEAKRFIEENDLEKIISEMMNSVVYEKPKQPVVYMIKYLAGLLSEDERKHNNLIIPEPYPKGRPIVKFPNLDKVNNQLKTVLTKSLWPNIKYKKTRFGGSVMNLIKISENKLNEKIGILLCDGECPSTFEPLVVPIVNFANHTENQKLEEFIPDPVLSTQAHFPYNDKIVLNTKLIRIAYSRNLHEYAFSSLINEKNRANVENSVVTAINNLISERVLSAGKFYFLKENENEAISILKESLHDYEEFDGIMNNAELKNNWPNNRCIFTSEGDEISIIILINFIDHLKLITTLKDKNCDFSKLFNSSYNIIKSLEKYLTFEFDKIFGYLNSCLDNLGAGMEISSLISLKNIINSENFDKKISSFDLDNYKSDKINCQFFSKNKFKLCHLNQLDFIQNYYNFISGLIVIDNKLELSKKENGKEDESLFELNFAKANELAGLTEQSEDLVNFCKNLNLLSNSANNKNDFFSSYLLPQSIQSLKVNSVANAYFNNFKKYENTLSPLGTNLNDLVQLFFDSEAAKGKGSAAAENANTDSFLSNMRENKLLLFSDLCEYKTFRHFIAQFILGFQGFNVEELDHIHKQDVFKNPPVVQEALKQKIKEIKITCYRNISELIFGLNNSLFGSAAKAKDLTLKALEALGNEFECVAAASEIFNKILSENEINLNTLSYNFDINNDNNKNKGSNKYENLNLDNLALIKVDNGCIMVLNDIEHMRFVCTDKSGEVNKTFMNLYILVNSLAKNLKFCYDKKLGFVTSNPECIGTGLVMEVVLEIKNLIKDEEKFKKFFAENIFRYEVINRDEGLVRVRNHVTIGYSENDLLGNFVLLINDILDHDK